MSLSSSSRLDVPKYARARTGSIYGPSTRRYGSILEVIAQELVEEMTRNTSASNPVEHYLKVNKLGLAGTSLHAGNVDPVREERIRFVLDRVIQRLIEKKHLSSAKSYRLKTPRMREYIGYKLDRFIRTPQREEPLYAGPGSVSSLTLDQSQGRLQENGLARFMESDSPIAIPGHSHTTRQKSPVAVPLPQTQRAQARFRVKGRAPPLPSVAVSFTTKQLLDEMSMATALNRFGRTPNFMGQAARRRIHDPPKAFQREFQLPEFSDHDITLNMAGRHLTIKAHRPTPAISARVQSCVFEETIEVPDGLHFDDLHIHRQIDGTLVIEEIPKDEP